MKYPICKICGQDIELSGETRKEHMLNVHGFIFGKKTKTIYHFTSIRKGEIMI